MAARTSRNYLLLLRESAGVLLSGKRPYSKLSYFIQTQQRLPSSSHPMGNLPRDGFTAEDLVWFFPTFCPAKHRGTNMLWRQHELRR